MRNRLEIQPYHKFFSKKSILIGLLLFFTACEKPVLLPVKIDEVRPKIAATKEIDVPVQRSLYKEAVGDHSGTQKLRLVPILKRAGEGSEIPEYRIFGISPGSAAYLLGLRDTDIIVALNEYILYNPERFKIYLDLLVNEKTASIEVRRATDQVIYKYRFID